MLVKTMEEIRSLIPNTMIKNFDMIESFIENSEKHFILPVLGKSLYDDVCEKYEQDKYLDKGNDKYKELVRRIQYPLINYALHKAIPKLNVAFAPGGGAIVMESSNTAIASKDRVSDAKASVLADAHEGIDLLLEYLEEDAREETPVFAEKWKLSRHYTLYAGSLINRASLFSQYVDINESRQRFNALKPDLSFCERVYIRPSLTKELCDDLIKFIERPESIEQPNRYEDIVEDVQRALALFVGSRQKDLMTPTMANDAIMMISTIRDMLQSDPDSFPAYKATLPEADNVSPESNNHQHQHPHRRNSRRAVFAMGMYNQGGGKNGKRDH